jgi:hypothetical protein
MTYPCRMLSAAVSCGAKKNVHCAKPSTRFFSMWHEGESIIVPICDEHVGAAYIPDRFIHDREYSEEEYLVYQVMNL